MFIIRYDKVVSRFTEFVQQNINAQSPVKFKRRLEVKYQRYKHQSYTTINHVLGQTHYTKNGSYGLEKVLKEEMVTHPKCKRLALRRGKQGLTCARDFLFLKQK